jgi:hypothetical protein
VQRGQVDAAIKLYRGLLVSMAQNPQINTELGVLLLTRRSPQQAIPHLQKAVSALPSAFVGERLPSQCHPRGLFDACVGSNVSSMPFIQPVLQHAFAKSGHCISV